MKKDNAVSIPVIVDDVKRAEGGRGFSMSRCAYFSIEFEGPSDDWDLFAGDLELPVVMLDLSAVISRPVPPGKLFDEPGKFEELYESVESQGQFFVDRNSLWFPNSLLREPARGHVYRIEIKLFTAALGYDSGSLSREDFLLLCRENPKGAWHSEAETAAFHKWTGHQVEMSKLNYMDKKPLAMKFQ